MTPLVALCILVAVVLVLHACATNIRDSEDLHRLAVRVHTLRNEYLVNLRGEPVEFEDEPEAATEPVGSIEPARAPASGAPVANAA